VILKISSIGIIIKVADCIDTEAYRCRRVHTRLIKTEWSRPNFMKRRRSYVRSVLMDFVECWLINLSEQDTREALLFNFN
ncbi:8984_t:CDS:1, partial [Funneliformis geosporum]